MKSSLLFATFACLLLVASTPARGGTVLHYDFDEASGDAIDTGSAPITNATLEGGATRSSDTPGGFGSSLDLRNDATYAHALEGDAADLDGLNQLTLITWLKVENYASGNNRLAAKQAAGTFGGFSWNMNAAPNTGTVGPDNFKIGLFLGGAGGFDFAYSDADVDAADWAFLAATYDGISGTITYYTGSVGDAVTQLGNAQVLATNPGVLDAGSALFGIGYTDAAPTADTSVDGFQDDLRILDEVLTLQQLEAIRQENIPEPTTLVLLLMAAGSIVTTRRRKT